jgi:hypothetical protein
VPEVMGAETLRAACATSVALYVENGGQCVVEVLCREDKVAPGSSTKAADASEHWLDYFVCKEHTVKIEEACLEVSRSAGLVTDIGWVHMDVTQVVVGLVVEDG